MKIKWALPLLAAALIALTGCLRVTSNVNTYSKLDSQYVGKTVGILPLEEADQDTLQFDDYAGRLAKRLAGIGFRVVPLVEGAGLPDYIAFLGYGVDGGQQVTSRRVMPQYGVTGYTPGLTTGTITTFGNQSTISGTTQINPTYGVTGYAPITTVETKYSRFVIVDIWRPGPKNAESEKVFEGELTSDGSCQNLAKVIDPLLDSMFEGFPNPQSGEVSQKVDHDC